MNNQLQSIVLDWIPDQSRVIDFGCGDGTLLKILAEKKSVKGYGVEIDGEKINYLPASVEDQLKIKPVYKVFPGWKSSTTGIKNINN